jgi:hypothetical protein
LIQRVALWINGVTGSLMLLACPDGLSRRAGWLDLESATGTANSAQLASALECVLTTGSAKEHL